MMEKVIYWLGAIAGAMTDESGGSVLEVAPYGAPPKQLSKRFGIVFPPTQAFLLPDHHH